MTEKEYVEHILSRAKAYADHLSMETLDSEAFHAWQDTKVALSPFTVVRLCEAWLAGKAREAETELEASESIPAPENQLKPVTGQI